MYILTLHGREGEGAYSVIDDDGEQTLYLFEQEDDAIRFAMMLEEERDYPEMHVLEVDNEIMILLGLKINRHMITSDSYLIISEKVNDVKVFVPFHIY